ncbi:hypothetical protein [Streptomyces sp. NPDC051546]|uniref:hypothetical protein n=1 Tax=Streptomyces sp. NPDC051546 TaxID=3365655 RepID=UPI0037914D3E
MFFRTESTRTTQNVKPTAFAFAEFTASNPHLHLDSVQMRAGTVTVHLHGTHALEHLAHWEVALGECAHSSDSFPDSDNRRLHYTERRTAVVAGTAFEAVAFHDGPGAYDPHHLVRPATDPAALARLRHAPLVPARRTGTVRRCVAALSVTAALAVTTLTAAAISQRVKAARPSRIPTRH